MSRAEQTPVKLGTPLWTPEQKAVIEAESDARLLVIAGPGTGKTAVACARVAWLADQGINPSSILMFSFTRAAVAELRDRILLWSGDPSVTSVRISTLDSQAWHFRYGTGTDFENLGSSFEENIEETIKLIEEGNEVLDEYLESTSHLIIDESQDLTAARARLVSALIAKVPDSCGVTVFADPCQAIYGFTNDFEDGTSGNGTFLESFDFKQDGFERKHLSRIHRTEDADVLEVFDAVRRVVDHNDILPTRVVETIQEHAYELNGELNDQLDENCLVLYRRRAQALMDAQHYPYYCRLRMSGLPPCIHPWIGAVFCRFTGNTIQLEDFVEQWEDTANIDSLLYSSIDPHTAWNLLHRHAAAKRSGINLVRLRELLCRPKPHADFLIPDYGMWGPIFGTIHGSKGREAENVVLMLPRSERTLIISHHHPDAERRNAEESRVYYVGATRARSLVEFSLAKSLIGATSVDGGRVWHSYKRGRGKPAVANVQFGVASDFDDTALVRRDFCESEQAASGAIASLLELHRQFVNCEENRPAPVALFLQQTNNGEKTEWRYRMELEADRAESQPVLGWMSPATGRDLMAVGREVQKKICSGPLLPPFKVTGWSRKSGDFVPALKMIGLRTVAVSPELADTLHEPFRSSGFLVAPIVFGFPQIMFRWKKRKSKKGSVA